MPRSWLEHCDLAALVLCATAIALAPRLAAAQGPGAANQRFAACLALQQKKDYPAAETAWQDFLKTFPRDPRVARATHLLGVCQYLTGKHAESAATLSGLIAASPQFEEMESSYLYLGAAQLAIAETGRRELYASAAKTFAAMEAAFPQGRYLAEAWIRRARCLTAQAQHPQTVDLCRQLIARFPQHPLVAEAGFEMALAQEEMGQADAARQSYAWVWTTFPEHPKAAEARLRGGEVQFARQQYAEALELYRAAAETKGFAHREYARLRQADAVRQLERYAEAAALYAAVLKQSPAAPHRDQALAGRWECLRLAGRIDEAVALCQSEPKLLASSEEVHALARALLKAKRPGEALGLVRKALALLEANKPGVAPGPARKALPQAEGKWAVPLLLDEADAMYDLPQSRHEATARYARIADDHPKHPLAAEARYLAARSALEGRDGAEALRQARAFAEAYPGHQLLADAMSMAAEAHLQLRELDRAAATYEGLIEKSGKHPRADLWKARLARCLLAQGQYATLAEKIEPLLAGMRDAAARAEAQCLAGFARLERKQPAAAVPLLAASAETAWSKADQAWLLLSQAHQQRGEAAKAEESLRQLLKAHPDSPLADRATIGLGQCRVAAGDAAAAAALFQQAIDRSPDGPLAGEAWFELGQARRKLDRAAEALDAYSRAAQRGGEPAARAMLEIGRLHARAKDYAKAREALIAVAYGYGYPQWQAEALLEAGGVEEAQGNKSAAAKLYRELIEKHPDTPSAATARTRLERLDH